MTSKSLNAGAASFTPTLATGNEGDDVSTTPSANELPDEDAATGPPAQLAAAMRDSFSEYAEMVENIEEEMDQDASAPPDNVPDGGQTRLPPHMVQHAAEFWFPECRDCSCCQGFKHGCKCAAANGGSCVCVGGQAPPVSSGSIMISTTTAGPSASPGGGGGGGYNHSGNNNPSPQSRYSGRGRGGRGGGGGRGKIPCKFYFSPSGCRFGDSCTFDHQTQG